MGGFRNWPFLLTNSTQRAVGLDNLPIHSYVIFRELPTSLPKYSMYLCSTHLSRPREVTVAFWIHDIHFYTKNAQGRPYADLNLEKKRALDYFSRTFMKVNLRNLFKTRGTYGDRLKWGFVPTYF